MAIPDPDEIQSQVTVVARPRNRHLRKIRTPLSVRMAVFLLSGQRQRKYRRRASNRFYMWIATLFAECYFDPDDLQWLGQSRSIPEVSQVATVFRTVLGDSSNTTLSNCGVSLISVITIVTIFLPRFAIF